MKTTARFLPTLALLLLLALQPFARAQVAGAPATIDYQGQVLDSAGAILAPTTPTNYTMQFRIYGQQSGGAIIWAESQIVTVDKGAFSVRLGQGVPIVASGGGNEGTTSDLRQAFNATDRYLGLTVTIPSQTPVEITPRLAFLSSPYSLVAERAKLADAATTATTAIAVSQASGGTSTLGTTTINNTFTLAAEGKINGGNVLEFGAGVAGKQTDAGKINYNTGLGALDIVGAGTTNLNRKIRLFAEGGVTISGAGGLSIDGPINATSFTGTGTNLASLNASNVTIGTLNDARLSTNVPKLNAANTFTTNQTISTRLVVNGDVGIGNAAPPERLTVGSFGDVRNNYISVETAGGNVYRSGIRLRHFDANNGFTIESDERNAPNGVAGLNFIENPGSSRMIIKRGGNVGIGTTDPVGRFTVASTIEDQLTLDRVNAGGAVQYGWRIGIESSTNNLVFYRRSATGAFTFASVIAATNGQYSAASDARLKKDIAPLPSVLDRVRRLEPKQYRFKENSADSPLQTGFIAQEVEPLFPDSATAVGEGDKALKALNYQGFGIIAVAAIRELAAQKDAENKALTEKNAVLTQRLDAAEKRLAALEAKMTKLSAVAEARPVKTASVAGR